jgi:hypothetical protein
MIPSLKKAAFLLIVTTAGSSLVAGCSPSSSDDASAKRSATQVVPAYEIQKLKPNPALSKVNIEVLLPQKLSQEELRRVAMDIRAAHDGYQKTWIAYYLKGMKPGAGAWATTHFTPELEVSILGATQAQEDDAKQQASAVTGKVLGRWYEEQYTHSSLVIYQTGKEYHLKTTFDNGQSNDEPLLRKGKTFTYKSGSYNGEYFKLLSDGALGLFNQEGKMFTQAAALK